jgi:hypothetical protein
MLLTNETLIEFLQEMIEKLQTKNYNKEEFLAILHHYVTMNSFDVYPDASEFTPEEVQKYLVLGWYISNNLQKPI